MKTFPVLGSALACMSIGLAAEPAQLTFGGERIGVPPLGLAESAKHGANTNSRKFGTMIPFESDRAESRAFSLNLMPRSPSLRRLPSEPRTPHVSRSSGMPIVIPNEAVDYAMTIVPPDPTIDFKLIVRAPLK
jgi:hypothetical protein